MSIKTTERGQSPRRLYRVSDAADYLGVGVSTLNRWRVEGTGPEYTALSPGCIRYEEQALDEFIAAGRRRSTSEVIEHD